MLWVLGMLLICPAVRADPRRGRAPSAQSMHAFKALVAPERESKPFAGIKFYGQVHMFHSMARNLFALSSAGASRADIDMLGKRSSQDRGVIRTLVRGGIRARGERYRHGSKQVVAQADRMVAAARRDPKARFMIYGDGGELLVEITRRMHAEPKLGRLLQGRVVAVEQTRHGSILMEEQGLRPLFPVVDMGRDPNKLRFETPMIARSVVQSIEMHLARLERHGVGLAQRKLDFDPLAQEQLLPSPMLWGATENPPQPPRDPGAPPPRGRVLIGGLGPLGREIGGQLVERGFAVTGYDPSAHRYEQVRDPMMPPGEPAGTRAWKMVPTEAAQEARARGIRVSNELEQSLRTFSPQLFISASGSAALHPRDPNQHLYAGQTEPRALLRSMPHQTLIAAADSAGTLRDLFAHGDRRPIATTPFAGRRIPAQRKLPFDRQHTVVRTEAGHELLALGGESVVNFWGKDPIPPSYIQFTRGLMFIAALKARSLYGQQAGYYGIDAPAKIERFVGAINAELGSQGLGDLLHPTF